MADNIIFNSKVGAEGFTVNGTDINDLYATKKELEDIVATGGDGNTKYELTKSGSTITLTGSDGSSYSVTDTDTHVEVLDTLESTDKTKPASANATHIAYAAAVLASQEAAAAQATADSKATTTYVDNAVASMVDSAPDTLNTLNELAAALGDDPNFATTVATQIGGKVSKSGDTMSGSLTVQAPGESVLGVKSNADSRTLYFYYNEDGTRGIFDSRSSSRVITARDTVESHTFYGNITGGAATATCAGALGQAGDTSKPMYFNWSGRDGQPTWLWGGEDGTNMYVYNPSNFSVSYAAEAGNANAVDGFNASSFVLKTGDTITATTGDTPLFIQSTTNAAYLGFKNASGDNIGYFGINNNNQPVFYDNTNRVLIHSGNIGSQSVNYANSAGSVAWSNVSGRPTALSQFTNDSGFITASSIPSVGNGTLTITQNGVSKGTFTANQSGNVTIALTDDNTTYSAATTYTAGLMSADDKTKLDNLATEGKCYTSEWANNVAWGSVYGRPTRLQDWPGTASAAYTADTAGECTGNSATASIAYNMREDPDTDDIEITNTGDGYIYINASSSNGFGGIIFSDGDGRQVALQDILDYCGI